MRFNWKIQLVAIAAAAIVIFLDQFTKSLVIQNLNDGLSHEFLGSLVKLHLVYNDSAAFSIGFGATWIFTLLSSIATLLLLWFSQKVETRSWALMLGVALGGVVGNLIDRLTRAPGFGIGHVVDFIQAPLDFPLFNIADSSIVVIAVITVIRIMRGDRLGKASD